MPFEIMDQKGASSSSHLLEDFRFPVERQVGLWKPNTVSDSQDKLITSPPFGKFSSSCMDVPLSSLAGGQEEKPRVGEKDFTRLSVISRNSVEHNPKSWSSLNVQLDTNDLIGNRTSVSVIQHESTLFSSSLSEIFSRKLRLENNQQHACKVAVHHVEEPFAHLEDLGRQTIGNLLPDEDDLFCGAIDELGLNTKADKGNEMEDFDLFSSGGGMELEGDDYLRAGQRNADLLGGLSDGERGLISSTVSQHPYGEHPSRTLFVRNIDSHVKDSEIKDLFEKYGDIKTLYTACKHHGFIKISYYDIRAAQNAMRALQNEPLMCRKLDIHYSIPKDYPSDVNQGSIVVSNLDSSVSADELQEMFGVFGEIKEICMIPLKDDHMLIEFYDVRAAEAALCALNQRDIAGKQMKLELSHPGGARRLVSPLGEEEDETTLIRSPMDDVTPARKVASGCMDNGYAQPFNTVVGSPMSSFIEPHRSSSVPISLTSRGSAAPISKRSSLKEQNQYLDGTKLRSQPFSSFHPHSLAACPDTSTNGFSYNSSSTIMDIAGSIDIRMTEGSSHIRGRKSNVNPMEPTGGVFGPSGNGSCSIQANNYMWSNSNPCQQHPSNAMVWQSSPSFVNGILANHIHTIAFTTASAVMPNARSAIHHIGSAPPVSSPFWDSQPTYAGESPDVSRFDLGSLGSMAFPGGSPSHSVEIASRNIFSHVGGNCMGMAKNGVLHAPQQICHLFPGRNPMISMPAFLDSPNQRLRNFSHRRNEVNYNSADKKQYELRIDCIIRGEDSRTTLMIKNIPNKYTSKMLLAAIDERCRGTYDFIYLPIDFKNKCNVGYAFINMIDPQQIIPFHKAFNGKKWEKFNSEKLASLAYARIQGKAALIAHFQNSSLMNEDKRCRPILFHTDGPNAGDHEPFPIGTNIQTRQGRS